jgi:hypothetical protein
MKLRDWPILRRIAIRYEPSPQDRSFIERAHTQNADGLDVTVALPDAAESHRIFGVPLVRRGIQPIWLRISNRGSVACRLHLVAIDPNYYTPLEAAAANHFSTGKRLVEFGLLGWVFLPLLLLLPVRLLSAWRANKRMDECFRGLAFRLRPIHPGAESSGFVFAPFDAGTKVVHVRLFQPDGEKEFVFSIPVPGLAADYLRRPVVDEAADRDAVECDVPMLRDRVQQSPRATSNAKASREGDPVNLVIVGPFQTILSAFGARWDQTETITLATCWKTAKAFVLGSEYRYSPVSPLYLFGRSQDFALQRIRRSINERLHLRLWLSNLRFEGQPVWIGQVSRDIGVRFTWRTWNLTTHRVDPDVDEARDYVLEDLLEAERVDRATYVDGVGACDAGSPRHNLTGDPYFTDGKRVAILVSETRTAPRFVNWA